MTSATIVVDFLNNNGINYFLVICGRFDKRQPPIGTDSCELLVFRKGVTGNMLVNL